MISDGLWRRRYGADPAIVGKTIDLNGQSHIVVGIAQALLLVPTGTLRYLNFGPRVDVWKPLAPTASELEGENWNQVLLLRLQPGESAERGRQQLQALLNAPSKALPTGVQLIPQLRPIRDIYASELRMRLLLLLGASTSSLLVACTNIASLFLARVASRSNRVRHEDCARRGTGWNLAADAGGEHSSRTFWWCYRRPRCVLRRARAVTCTDRTWLSFERRELAHPYFSSRFWRAC